MDKARRAPFWAEVILRSAELLIVYRIGWLSGVLK